MERLTETTLQALMLLLSGDSALWSIVAISCGVSLRAILLVVPAALLMAFWLAYTRFPGRRVSEQSPRRVAPLPEKPHVPLQQ